MPGSQICKLVCKPVVRSKSIQASYKCLELAANYCEPVVSKLVYNLATSIFGPVQSFTNHVCNCITRWHFFKMEGLPQGAY